MAYKVTQVRRDIYRILDRVIRTGVPVQIEKDGSYLSIIPHKKKSKLANLRPHNVIVGNPSDLVHVDWSSEWNQGLT